MRFLSLLFLLSVSIARDLTTYDYEVVRQVARISGVAYLDGSKYREQLSNLGWEFTDLYGVDLVDGKNFPVGVVGVYQQPQGSCALGGLEKLVVVAYGGTQLAVPETYAADFLIKKSFLSCLSDVFSNGSYVHGGILDYYLSFQTQIFDKVLSQIEGDSPVIFTGHSLGAALAQLSVMDYYGWCFKSNKTPDFSRMSLLTLAGPAVLSSDVAERFNSWFPNTSHLRLYMDADPVSHVFGTFNDSRFNHAGFGIRLPSVNLIAHGIVNYIRKVDRKNGHLDQLWPKETVKNYAILAQEMACERVRRQYKWAELEQKIDQLFPGSKTDNSAATTHLKNWYYQSGFYLPNNAIFMLNLIVDYNSMLAQEAEALIAKDQERAKFMVTAEEDLMGDVEIAQQNAMRILANLSGLGAFGL